MITPLALLYAQPPDNPGNGNGNGGGARIIEPGQPPVMIHATIEAANLARGNGAPPRHSRSNNLTYHGGSGGIGVETTPKVYLVLWGAQWNGNDPSGEAAILQNFYSGAGSSAWLNSVTQYCQGVASGTISCGAGSTPAGNEAGIFAGPAWFDNAAAAPAHPSQSQLAAEAVKAAQYFGNTNGADNASVQYVIATSHGNSSSGFGSSYCAWHSSTSSTVGNLAYTNLPYITDAGSSCGANYNGLGSNAGITIVGGHEMAETITDQFPSTGWLDSGGAENGDKCAWIGSGQGASANVTFPGGGVFPVQSLWSNAFNSGAGGCVLAYP
jgi:serine protease